MGNKIKKENGDDYAKYVSPREHMWHYSSWEADADQQIKNEKNIESSIHDPADHGDENFGILQKASADDFSENSSSSGSATDDSDSDSDDSDSSSSSSSSRQLEAGISERRSLISQ